MDIIINGDKYMTHEIETIFTHETDSGNVGELGIDKEAKLYWEILSIPVDEKRHDSSA